MISVLYTGLDHRQSHVALITGYNVTIAMASTSVSAADFMYETAALEPYTSYTVTVTAITDVNMTSCSLDFTTSMEQGEPLYEQCPPAWS